MAGRPGRQSPKRAENYLWIMSWKSWSLGFIGGKKWIFKQKFIKFTEQNIQK